MKRPDDNDMMRQLDMAGLPNDDEADQDEDGDTDEDEVDEASEDSFPASDPPSSY